jgi:hypothetical protein
VEEGFDEGAFADFAAGDDIHGFFRFIANKEDDFADFLALVYRALTIFGRSISTVTRA